LLAHYFEAESAKKFFTGLSFGVSMLTRGKLIFGFVLFLRSLGTLGSGKIISPPVKNVALLY
jgi:hypothetical protein